jgi:transposase InsO family protein
MCKKLEVSRSGFYAWMRRRESAHRRRDRALARRIETHFEESAGTYGSPRVHALLLREGERVGRKRVARLMREAHLRARSSRIYRRIPAPVLERLGIANQARERHVTGPNQVWRGDVTYIKVPGAWRYLAVVLDQYSRRLLGFKLGSQHNSELTVAALRMAISKRRPPAGLIFHSDRGSEYGAYLYRDRLSGRGIVQSMNRPKTMTDNAHVESFFHSMKSEVIHGRPQLKPDELESVVRRYIARYNRTRIHSALAYRSPIDYERTNARN